MSFADLAAPAGQGLWGIAFRVMLVCWAVFGLLVLAASVRARWVRRRGGEEPALRSSASMWGLALEVAAFAIVWIVRRPAPDDLAAGWILAAIVLALASLAVAGWALAHLGRQFRVNAVVAADHELVDTGPYTLVRHPLFASMLGLLVSNAIVVSSWWAGFAALAVYIAGTEIRVRDEERLLAQRFPEEHAQYRTRVRAYIPFVR